MKRFSAATSCYVAVFIVLALGARSAAAQLPEANEKAFFKLQQNWAEARKNADMQFLENFYAKEFSVGLMNGGESTREQDLAMFSSGDLKPAVIDDREMRVFIYGETAMVTGIEHLEGAYKGHTGQFNLRFTNVFVYRDGRWQIVRHQAAQIPGGDSKEQQGLVSCKRSNQKTGELGCWILASQPLGVLNGPVYWMLDSFPSKERAERAKGATGIVVEALGKFWLLTVGEKSNTGSIGTSVTQIGPLPINEGQNYTAQYMEANLQPGMVSRTHVHGGIEVFYTESGETCLETPDGKQVGRKGVDIVIPAGVPMELTATGTELRRGLMLVLHDSSKPATTPVDSWK